MTLARHDNNECLNPVTRLPAPLRVLCLLTRGNRQPCRPAAPADDPDFLVLNDRLAANVFATGDTAHALALWGDVVTRRRHALGPDHRKTFNAAGNLAMCLNSHGLRDEAQELYEFLLEQGTRVFGADDPDVLRLQSGYATYLYDLDRYDEALSLYKDVLLGYQANNRRPATGIWPLLAVNGSS
jgi:tetratricopeptide (TPR) repeat protein